MGGAWLTNVDLGCVFMGCDVRRLTRKSLASNHERLAMDVPAVERQVGGYRNRTCSANTPFSISQFGGEPNGKAAGC